MPRKKQSQHGAKASVRGGGRSHARSSATRPSAPKKKKSKTRRSVSRGPFVLVLLVLLLVVAAWSLYPAARVQYQEERNKARLEAELDGLKERNVELRAQVDRLKTPEGVEDVARQDLGLVKEGENLYVVMDSEAESVTVPVDPEPRPDNSTWMRVLDAVFGFEG